MGELTIKRLINFIIRTINTMKSAEIHRQVVEVQGPEVQGFAGSAF